MKKGRLGVIVFCAVLIGLFSVNPVRAEILVAEPDTYDFYTVDIGDSATMTGTLTNTDGGTLIITDYEWTYNPLGAFSVTRPPHVPYSLPGYASTDYQVTFTPPGYSFWSATLRFHTNGAFTPTVDVTFWGVWRLPATLRSRFQR